MKNLKSYHKTKKLNKTRTAKASPNPAPSCSKIRGVKKVQTLKNHKPLEAPKTLNTSKLGGIKKITDLSLLEDLELKTDKDFLAYEEEIEKELNSQVENDTEDYIDGETDELNEPASRDTLYLDGEDYEEDFRQDAKRRLGFEAICSQEYGGYQY